MLNMTPSEEVKTSHKVRCDGEILTWIPELSYSRCEPAPCEECGCACMGGWNLCEECKKDPTFHHTRDEAEPSEHVYGGDSLASPCTLCGYSPYGIWMEGVAKMITEPSPLFRYLKSGSSAVPRLARTIIG